MMSRRLSGRVPVGACLAPAAKQAGSSCVTSWPFPRPLGRVPPAPRPCLAPARGAQDVDDDAFPPRLKMLTQRRAGPPLQASTNNPGFRERLPRRRATCAGEHRARDGGHAIARTQERGGRPTQLGRRAGLVTGLVRQVLRLIKIHLRSLVRPFAHSALLRRAFQAPTTGLCPPCGFPDRNECARDPARSPTSGMPSGAVHGPVLGRRRARVCVKEKKPRGFEKSTSTSRRSGGASSTHAHTMSWGGKRSMRVAV